MDFIKNNPEEAASIMANILNIEKDEVLNMMKGIKFFGPEENLLAMSNDKKAKQISLYESGNLINKYLLRFGITSKSVDINQIIDDSIVKNVIKNAGNK